MSSRNARRKLLAPSFLVVAVAFAAACDDDEPVDPCHDPSLGGCNPPHPVLVCPQSPPSAGEACGSPPNWGLSSSECRYTNPDCVIATCNQTWLVAACPSPAATTGGAGAGGEAGAGGGDSGGAGGQTGGAGGQTGGAGGQTGGASP